MTVVNPKSISGINSITTGSGSDNLLTIHTNNGTERLRVDSTGATKIVTGIVTTLTATTGIVTTLTANTTTHLSDVTFTGSSANIIFDQSDDALEFNDDAKATFGTGADTTFTHSGADFAITNTTGNLNILNNSADAVQIRHGNETMIKAVSDGAVELYHDNTKRFETTSTGVTITGGHTGTIIAGDFTLDNQSQAGRDVFFDQSADRFQFKDNLRASFGDDHDLMIYHDTNHSYIYDAGTGDLKIQTNGAKIQLGKDNGETCANFVPDGAVELYHNNEKRISTITTGLSVTRQNSGEYFNVNANYGSSGDQAIEVSGDLTFYTNGSSIAARLDQDGLKFNTDTAAANALDDYEEGTWTPTFGGQLNPQSYSQQAGEYTKIGNVVVANCYLKLAGDPGSYASNVSIGGLPFVGTNVAGASAAGVGVLAYQTNFISATDGRGNFTAMVNGNQSLLRLYTPDGTYFLWSEVDDRTQQVRFSMTYRTHE